MDLDLKCRIKHMAEAPDHLILEFCEKHKRIRKYYCNKDQEVVCDKCWKLQHSEHEVIPIEGKKEEISRIIAEGTETVSLVEKIIQSHIEFAESAKSQISE